MVINGKWNRSGYKGQRDDDGEYLAPSGNFLIYLS
jgi:hypothetical protein